MPHPLCAISPLAYDVLITMQNGEHSCDLNVGLGRLGVGVILSLSKDQSTKTPVFSPRQTRGMSHNRGFNQTIKTEPWAPSLSSRQAVT